MIYAGVHLVSTRAEIQANVASRRSHRPPPEEGAPTLPQDAVAEPTAQILEPAAVVEAPVVIRGAPSLLGHRAFVDGDFQGVEGAPDIQDREALQVDIQV